MYLLANGRLITRDPARGYIRDGGVAVCWRSAMPCWRTYGMPDTFLPTLVKTPGKNRFPAPRCPSRPTPFTWWRNSRAG